MKVKTSVTLSRDLLAEMDERIPQGESRSEYIEGVLKRHLRQLRRDERNRRDRELLAAMVATELQESEAWFELQPDLTEFGDAAATLVDSDDESSPNSEDDRVRAAG